MGKELERAAGFARELEKTYGEDLLSVVLYGSAARGDYREGISDLNLLVILRKVDPAALRRASKLARKWAEEGNPPPLMFGEDEWARSADVFPIEYSDIRAAHRVLHGTDPLTRVEIDREHLRLQCERELKGKNIQLREQYLLVAEKPEELGALLSRSFPTFLTLFRAGLRLVAFGTPEGPAAVIAEIGRRAGFDPSGFESVLAARSEGKRLKLKADDPIAVSYLEAVQKLTRWLDQVSTSPS